MKTPGRANSSCRSSSRSDDDALILNTPDRDEARSKISKRASQRHIREVEEEEEETEGGSDPELN